MAALHDLLPPLMSAAHRDLSRLDKVLSAEDVAGVAVLLGLAGELLAERTDVPTNEQVDPAALRSNAHDSLIAARRLSKTRDR